MAHGNPVLRFAKAEGVAHLTLDRPRVLNAFDTTLRDALFEALAAIRQDPEVRVVLLDGAGAGFCAGGDLNEFGSAPSPLRARQIRRQRDVWESLRTLPQPLVASIHGVCVGSGLELALACDLRIVATDARFAFPETGRGMIPGAGGSQTAPRQIGIGRALDWILSGREFGAAEAWRIGLASLVVADDERRERADSIARRLARQPRRLLRACRRSLWEGLDLSLADGLGLEKRLARQGMHAGGEREE